MKPATQAPTFLHNWQKSFVEDLKTSIGYCMVQHMETHEAINEPTVADDSLYIGGIRKLRAKSVLIIDEINTLVNWANGTVALGYFPSKDERHDVLQLAVKTDKHFGELASLYRDMRMHTPILKETTDMTHNIKLTLNYLDKFIRYMQ